MVSDLDIHRSAAVLIREHGDKAWNHAGLRAFSLKCEGDDEGAVTWLRIQAAVEEQQKGAPAEGDEIH